MQFLITVGVFSAKFVAAKFRQPDALATASVPMGLCLRAESADLIANEVDATAAGAQVIVNADGANTDEAYPAAESASQGEETTTPSNGKQLTVQTRHCDMPSGTGRAPATAVAPPPVQERSPVTLLV